LARAGAAAGLAVILLGSSANAAAKGYPTISRIT